MVSVLFFLFLFLFLFSSTTQAQLRDYIHLVNVVVSICRCCANWCRFLDDLRLIDRLWYLSSSPKQNDSFPVSSRRSWLQTSPCPDHVRPMLLLRLSHLGHHRSRWVSSVQKNSIHSLLQIWSWVGVRFDSDMENEKEKGGYKKRRRATMKWWWLKGEDLGFFSSKISGHSSQWISPWY